MTASTDIPIVYSTPLETRTWQRLAPAGMSLQRMLDYCVIDPAGLHVFVNDRLIPPVQYGSVFPQPNDRIFICIALRGGGDGKNPLRTIAMIGVMIVALYTQQWWAVNMVGGAFGGAVAGMAVGMVGALAVNALIPPATADTNLSTGSLSVKNRFSITGTRNQFLPFENIPKTLGLDRVYPPYAAKPYTQIHGQDQYVYMLFCLGRGPLEASGEKFGDTLCSNYTTKVEYGTGAELPRWYNTDSIDETTVSMLLDPETYPSGTSVNGDYTTVTTEECNEIGLDFYSPGLVYVNPGDGEIYSLGVEIQIQTRRVGTSTWINPLNYPDYYRVTISAGGSYTEDPVYQNNLQFFGNKGNARRVSIQFDPRPASRTKYQWDVRICRHWTWRNESETDRSGTFWKTITVKKGTDPSWDGVQSDVYLTAIKSISVYEAPVDAPDDMHFVSVRAKATDELNGVPENFNLIVQAHHPVYADGAYSYQATSLPPWIFADLNTGSANHRAVSRIYLDTDMLVDWAATCEAEGYEFNGTISNTKLSEIRRLVCAAGRAAPHQVGNKHTIIFDGEQDTIYQVFSPRNSWGFKGTKVFPERPHALRVQFRNKEIGYEADERIVYDDGYNAGNATKFESIEYTGINDPEMIYKMARWDFAQSRLRPEVFELNVDIEYLVAGRGKRVAVAHDVPMWGSGWPRIKTVETTDNGDGTHDVALTVDDVCTFETGKDYAILIRVVNGDPISVAVDHPGAGEATSLSCTLADASAAMIAAGDLLLFGEAETHYHDLIIKAIYPMGDLAARLELVEYNPDIYDDETVYGEIPEFDSDITSPIDREKLPPPVPSIDKITSDESVMIPQGDGTWIACMVVAYKYTSGGSTIPATELQVQYRYNDGGADTMAWQTMPPQPPDTGSVSIFPVEEGYTYDVRIRSKSVYGLPSDWAATTHKVEGKSAPPPQVAGFAAVFDDNEVKLSWTKVGVWDAKDYGICYGSSGDAWDDVEDTVVYTDATYLSLPAQWSGTRYFFIKARDTSGNLSTIATSIDVEIVAPSVSGITAEVVDNNVLLRWTNTKGSLPIDFVEMRKGTTFATATVIGEKKGTFTSVFETSSAQYKYWLAPVDIAGNYGTEQSITATVNEPPDYTLNQQWNEDFDDLDSTTNVLVQDDGTAIAPFDTTETVDDYFTDNGFTCEQDAITAGYTYVAEPVPTTAECYQEFDAGAVIGQATASLDLDTTPVNGGATITEYLAEKELVGDSWNEDTDNPANWTSFRYVRDRFAFVSDGTEFDILNTHSIRLDSKIRRDQGDDSVTTASSGKTVSFNKSFALVKSIVVTPNDSSNVIIPVVDFDGSTANPTEFTVYLYNTSGTKVSGDFYWEATGV